MLDSQAGVNIQLKPNEALDRSYAGTLRIVSIEHPDERLQGVVREWQQLLRSYERGIAARRVLYQGQLEEIPWINAGRSFHTNLQYGSFRWGNAVLFITHYVQGNSDGPIVNSDLILTVQGFTDDQRYALNGRFQIGHPRLADAYAGVGTGELFMEQANRHAERFLNRQSNASFEPTIDDYLAFLAALEIESPR